ncbi:MAG: type II toxin-antitoxin system RelE/ParE family toxin [Candidatus Marsarchaeota archaeon]|nr:type II toxin-antitoxin system RelE/ParE family toxin [Candidatus Marsarchaeota archaeon]
MRKLKKADRLAYERIGKKIDELCANPHMAKPMSSYLKGTWRVHVGHFVMLYRINEAEEKLEFYDFEHHDKAYL